MISRRTLVVGGSAATVLGAAGLVADSPRGRRLLGWERSSPDPVPGVAPGEVLTGSFASAAMRATTGWSIAYPTGHPPGTTLPFLLTLHGRGGTHQDAILGYRYDRFLSATVSGGTPAFAVVSVDGGVSNYYHRRADGSDFPRMLSDELLPLLSERGLRVDRFGVHGISMGGYGALLLAQELGPKQIRVALADAPALWERWEDSAPGAFDGRRDFHAHDVLAGVTRARSIPTRVTCGSDDPFRPGVDRLLTTAPWIDGYVAPGAHNSAWWRHVAPAQLAFAGRHLGG